MSSLRFPDLWSKFRATPAAFVEERIPDLLVFEIDKELETFFESTADLPKGEYDIDLLVSEVLLHISHRAFLEEGLHELQNQMREVYSQEKGFSLVDGPIMAESAVQLGRGMVKKFDAINAYLPDGTLPYQFKKFINTYCYTPIPVLEKCLDFLP